MVRPKLAIVDYGCGNILSVNRAATYCGAISKIVSHPDEISSSDIVVVPGVGAFPQTMNSLYNTGFAKKIMEVSSDGGLIIGICAGMQVLFEDSQEFFTTKGLGLVPGHVVGLPKVDLNGESLLIPNIGWHKTYPTEYKETYSSIFNTVGYVYLSHSFHVLPDNKNLISAFFEYGGHKIVAAVQCENILGLQFHPEKSGEYGLHIFENSMKYFSN